MSTPMSQGLDTSDSQSVVSSNTLNTLHTAAPTEHVIDERRTKNFRSLTKLWGRKSRLPDEAKMERVSDTAMTNRQSKPGGSRPPLFRKMLRKLSKQQNNSMNDEEEIMPSFESLGLDPSSISFDTNDSKSVGTYYSMTSITSQGGTVRTAKRVSVKRMKMSLPKKLKTEQHVLSAEKVCRYIVASGEFDEAMIMYENILSAKQSMYGQKDYRLGNTYQCMGNVEAILMRSVPQRGSFSQSIIYYRLAIESYELSPTNESYEQKLANAWNGIGDLYYQRKECKEEREEAIAAYERYFLLVGREEDFSTLGSLGELYFMNEMFDLSIETFQKSLQLRKDKDEGGYGIILLSIGQCYERKADGMQNADTSKMLYERALQSYEEARGIFKSIKHIQLSVDSNFHSGHICLKLRNVDDALKFFALISQTIVEVHGENINEMESDDPLLERLNAALRLVFRGGISKKNSSEALIAIFEFYSSFFPRHVYSLTMKERIEFARILSLLGNHQQSISILEMTLKSLLAREDVAEPTDLIRALACLGHTNIGIGSKHYSQALGCFQGAKLHYGVLPKETLSDSINSSLERIMVEVCHSCALINFELRNYDGAKANFLDALSFTPSDCLSQRAKILNNVANVERYLNQYENSIGSYIQSIDLDQEVSGQTFALIGPMTNLGNAFLAYEDVASALEVFKEAEEVVDKLSEKSLDVHTFRNLYMLYISIGDANRRCERLDIAKKNYKVAIDVVDECPDISATLGKLKLAQALSQGQDFLAARMLYNQIIIRKSHSSPQHIALALKAAANIQVKSEPRDLRNLKAGVDSYEKALEIERKMCDSSIEYESRSSPHTIIIRSLLNSGNIYRKMHDFSSAEKTFNEGVFRLNYLMQRCTGSFSFDQIHRGPVSLVVIFSLFRDLGKLMISQKMYLQAKENFLKAKLVYDTKVDYFSASISLRNSYDHIDKYLLKINRRIKRNMVRKNAVNIR